MIWKYLLEDIDRGDSAKMIAERFGIGVHEVEALKQWERHEREAIAKWLLRDE